jgi:CRP-like cAMP-binding protein
MPVAEPNKLLAVFGTSELSPHAQRLRKVELGLRNVLCECGDRLHQVYFPQTAVVTQQLLDVRRRPVAATIVGSEGVVGLGACLSGGPSLSRLVVLVPGEAVTLDRETLTQAVEGSAAFRTLLSRYGDAFACQSLQLAACMARHSLEQRLACFLLSCAEAREGKFQVAEEGLSVVLGVRRSLLVLAARTLQRQGSTIEYEKGMCRIVDRQSLSRFACECHQIIQARYDRLQTDAV